MTFAHNGACDIYYETFGDAAHPTLLLVNGLGGQCINFQDDWCNRFAATGLHVIRFDNRDVGLSSKFTDAPVGDKGNAYLLSDMANDAIAVLDTAGIERAHILGLSMGGMIVQTIAINHPHRVITMTSVMSTTGEPEYGQPAPSAYSLLTAPPAVDRESFVANTFASLREWGSPEFADESRWRADAERSFDRCFHPAGTARQFMAVRASGPRAEALRSVQIPTLVMHGDRDTLIDASGGRRTAEIMPNARFELIEGMGHDYPPQLWDRWVELVSQLISEARGA
jgi:pimeloyl-ACP methyl ester carboxylesterase